MEFCWHVSSLETSNRSSQAAHCWNPTVLNEVTFQRNNMSWTQEGTQTSIHKLVPVVQVLFLWFFWKTEVLGPMVITSLWSCGSLGNIQLCSGHFAKAYVVICGYKDPVPVSCITQFVCLMAVTAVFYLQMLMLFFS